MLDLNELSDELKKDLAEETISLMRSHVRESRASDVTSFQEQHLSFIEAVLDGFVNPPKEACRFCYEEIDKDALYCPYCLKA